ncbi:uncharacterized protein [Aegilops tauschii subsp. strangulata]|uniref:uncharacterized protein isoform X2 n=1 Tax=Aegilops tauschii subsp. strangulata TaxID=200361 RepID=UPI00098A2FEB|nr:copper-transporting ATPase PAA1, chloroplastic-like isoform X2 [Aegilops tauschii subsp. strangulata]
MEPAVITAVPPASVATRLLPTSIGGGGDRGGGRSDGGGGGGGGGGGDSGAGAAAAMALVEAGMLDGSDVILLHVGPEVASATIDLAKAAAVVRTTPEAMATKDWHKELGEKLANHLRNCGFESHMLDEAEQS